MNHAAKERFLDSTSKNNSQPILTIYAIVITLLASLLYLKLDYKNKQYEALSVKYRSTSLFIPSSTPTPPLPIPKPEQITCLENENVFYSQDKNFAACQADGQYTVFKKSASTGDGEYRRFWEETGRIEQDEQIIVSYADYYSTNYNLRPHEIGSSVFKIETKNNSLELLFEARDIPNLRDWLSGSEFTPQFILFSSGESWIFSPDNNIMLFLTAACTGCSTTLYLYAYNFPADELIFLGEPYIANYQDEREKFEINWLNTKTLKWREGNWRERKDEEYSGDDFPFVQNDLGYKITRF